MPEQRGLAQGEQYSGDAARPGLNDISLNPNQHLLKERILSRLAEEHGAKNAVL
jgi:hypothetical protein